MRSITDFTFVIDVTHWRISMMDSKVYRLITAHFPQWKYWNQYQERCISAILQYKHALCVFSLSYLCSRCQPSFPLKEASQQRPSPQSPLLSLSQKVRATSKKQRAPLSRTKWDSVKSKFISQHPSLTPSDINPLILPSLYIIFEQHVVSMIDCHVMLKTHFLGSELFMSRRTSILGWEVMHSSVEKNSVFSHQSVWLGITGKCGNCMSRRWYWLRDHCPSTVQEQLL